MQSGKSRSKIRLVAAGAWMQLLNNLACSCRSNESFAAMGKQAGLQLLNRRRGLKHKGRRVAAAKGRLSFDVNVHSTVLLSFPLVGLRPHRNKQRCRCRWTRTRFASDKDRVYARRKAWSWCRVTRLAQCHATQPLTLYTLLVLVWYQLSVCLVCQSLQSGSSTWSFCMV